MRLNSLFAPALAGAVAVLLLAPMISCGGSVEASVERDQNADGTHTTKTMFSVKQSWFMPASPTAPSPNYSVAFQEYPANRMLLSASATYPAGLNGTSPGQAVTVPVSLESGLHYTAQYQVGSWTQTYDVVLSVQTGLPSGTYLMDSPGMMEDVVIATRNHPNSSVQVTITGNLGSNLISLMPSQTFGIPASDIPEHLTINVPGSQAYMIGQTVVSRPDDRPPYNHSPYTKTMGD